MNTNMDGKRVLVTGAGTGIGRGIALAFAAEGAAVAVHYSRSSAGAEAVVEEIVSGGGKAAAFKADFSDVKPLQAMAREAVTFLGGLDVLVNCAGMGDERDHLLWLATDPIGVGHAPGT